MLGSKPVTEFSEPPGAVLLNLGRFPGGPMSALERIPTGLAGIYTWYRAFDYPDDPELLLGRLLQDLEAPKFLERSGPIKPYYDVTIRSRSWFSEAKRQSLKDAIGDPNFRRGLLETLSLSVLLQSPLYIGKAIDLRQRIKAHLKEGSILRERLSQVNVAIEKTLVFLVPNGIYDSKVENSISEESLDESGSGNDDEIALTAHEMLYEEIYSRLFNPQFTIRLG